MESFANAVLDLLLDAGLVLLGHLQAHALCAHLNTLLLLEDNARVALAQLLLSKTTKMSHFELLGRAIVATDCAQMPCQFTLCLRVDWRNDRRSSAVWLSAAILVGSVTVIFCRYIARSSFAY